MENLPTSSPSPSVVTPSSGGNLNKFAVFALIIVVLLIIGGAVYYLLSSPTKTDLVEQKQLTQERTVATPQPESSFLKKLNMRKVESKYNFFKSLEEKGTQEFLADATLETTLKGTVWMGVSEETNIDEVIYSYTLMLFDADQREVRVHFTSEELSSMKLENLNSINDIAQGDVVSVKRITNLLNDSTSDTVTVTRISSSKAN